MLMLIVSAGVMAIADNPVDANLADLRCVAVFATLGPDAPSEEIKQGLASGFMYYVGRIDARDSSYDIEGGLIHLLKARGYAAQFQANAQRCGGEMQKLGAEIQEIGKALEAAFPPMETQPG